MATSFYRVQDQSFEVGDVTVMITDIRGGKVRFGFDAPEHLGVFRKELYDEIMSARAAGNPPPPPRRHSNGGGMLVLAREPGESLVIVDHDDWDHPIAWVRNSEVRGHRVRVVVDAPLSIAVRYEPPGRYAKPQRQTAGSNDADDAINRRVKAVLSQPAAVQYVV